MGGLSELASSPFGSTIIQIFTHGLRRDARLRSGWASMTSVRAAPLLWIGRMHLASLSALRHLIRVCETLGMSRQGLVLTFETTPP